MGVVLAFPHRPRAAARLAAARDIVEAYSACFGLERAALRAIARGDLACASRMVERLTCFEPAGAAYEPRLYRSRRAAALLATLLDAHSRRKEARR
jgi:hypothetical protein